MALAPAALLAVVISLAVQPEPNLPLPLQDSVRIRRLSQAVHAYSQTHDGQIPADLASLVPELSGRDAASADVIRECLIAPGIASKDVPKDAQPSWADDHASYVYLGKANVGLGDFPQWSEVAIAHLRFDEGHPPENGPNDPEHQLFTVAFLDGHTSLMPRAKAQAIVQDSKALIDAVSTGGPLPEQFQLVSDLNTVHAAIIAYTKANDGDLPPDLGATLAYVKETKRLKTPAQRAGAFLSPRVRANVHVPEEPTPEWVHRHASFIYAGAGGVKLSSLEDPQRTLLLYIRPEDATPARVGIEGDGGFPVVSVWGGVERANRTYYDWVIPYSKKVVEFARTGAPLPDVTHAMRDLRLIQKAIEAYAKAHDGRLPADLGQTVEYLPEGDKLSVVDRARVYLSPHRERVVQPPENADEAWVAAHASYKYLGDAGLSLKEMRKGAAFCLVHAPLEEEVTMMQYNIEEPYRVVPAAMSLGGVWPYMAEHFQEHVLDPARDQIQKIKRHEVEK